MLHDSLLELADVARGVTTAQQARGVLLEAQQLMHNALDHRANERELTEWFSAVVAAILASPAARECGADMPGDGLTVAASGAVGRGDATPVSVISWAIVIPELSADTESAPKRSAGLSADAALRDLIASAGLTPTPARESLSPATSAQWQQRSLAAVADGEDELLAELIDAGLLPAGAPLSVLLERAISHRPPALRSFDGLPDRRMPVNIREHLLVPIVDVARWAGAHGGQSTPARLEVGAREGRLSPAEADSLLQAWETGISLQLKRWFDRVAGQSSTLEDLSIVDRTAYGAAARMVAVALRSLASRHGIPLENDR